MAIGDRIAAPVVLLCGGTEDAPHDWTRMTYLDEYAEHCGRYVCQVCGHVLLLRKKAA